MVGLGPVTPQVKDGAAAPSSPLSNSVEAADIGVFLLGERCGRGQRLIRRSGAWIRWVISGQFHPAVGWFEERRSLLLLTRDEALNVMATINVSGFTGRAVELDSSRRAAMLRNRTAAAGPTFGKHTKNFRRALPER